MMNSIKKLTWALVPLTLAAWDATVHGNPCQPALPLPPGFSESVVATFDIAIPLVESLPDGRLLVGAADGRAWLMGLDGSLGEPFVDFAVVPYEQNGQTTTVEAEGGVLGGVASPTFLEDRHIYLYHTTLLTAPGGRRLQVTRFTADAEGHGVEPGSQATIIDLPDQFQHTPFHSGGGLRFGPDGKLYLSLGDDGNVAAPQDLNNIRGKVLRLNPDGSTPTDNPFFSQGGNASRNMVYARGFRNPFRMFFDTPRGLHVMCDTGQARWEEMSHTFPGANHGWTGIEGPLWDHPGITPPANYSDPFFAYRHGTGAIEGLALVSAIPYYGDRFPEEFHGDYFVTEWGFFGQLGKIFRLQLDEAGNLEQATVFQASNPFGYADITVDINGDLVYSIANTIEGQPLPGQIRRITYTEPDQPPTVVMGASVTEGPAPLAVQFTSTATDDNGTPVWCWKFGGPADSQARNPSRTFTSAGVYNVTLTAQDQFRSRTVKSLQIRVWQHLALNLQGTLFNASGETPEPSAGIVMLYQPDGVTPLIDGPVEITDGSFSVVAEEIALFGNEVVADFAAPGLVTRRVRLAGTALTGTPVSVYLAASALQGTVLLETGLAAGNTDVFLQRDVAGTLQPYPIPGGIDLASPLPPTGVLHGTRTITSGHYYFPVRTADLPAQFEVTANLQPTITGFLPASGSVEVDPPGEASLDLLLQQTNGTSDCQEIFAATPLTPAFSEVQAIFNANCVGCHGVIAPNADLTLAEGFAFSSIVDMPSREITTRKLIDTVGNGDPVNNSWLVEKVRCSTPTIGAMMPPTGKLTGREIDIIGYWARRRGHFDQTATAVHTSTTETSSPALITFLGGAEGSGAPFAFDWDFGNGTTTRAMRPTAPFVVAEGSRQFDVTMTARRTNGTTVGTEQVTITVHAPEPRPGNNPPVVELAIESVDDRRATLMASATDPDGDAIVAYEWDFFDAGNADRITTAGTQVMEYPGPGRYRAVVRAYDNGNAVGEASVLVDIAGELDSMWRTF